MITLNNKIKGKKKSYYELKNNCDWWTRHKKRCGKKAYCEVYRLDNYSWSYLCLFHYRIDRLYCKLHRVKTHGYCIVYLEDDNT